MRSATSNGVTVWILLYLDRVQIKSAVTDCAARKWAEKNIAGSRGDVPQCPIDRWSQHQPVSSSRLSERTDSHSADISGSPSWTSSYRWTTRSSLGRQATFSAAFCRVAVARTAQGNSANSCSHHFDRHFRLTSLWTMWTRMTGNVDFSGIWHKLTELWVCSWGFLAQS